MVWTIKSRGKPHPQADTTHQGQYLILTVRNVVAADTHLGRHAPGQTPPWADTPQADSPRQTPLTWADTPWAEPPGRHPPCLGRYPPPGQTPPPGKTPPGQTQPWADTHPPGQTLPRQTPPPPTPSRRLLQRTVRILLECILVDSTLA